MTYVSSTAFSLANDGDAVQLYDGVGTIHDFVYYDDLNTGSPAVDDDAVAAGIWKDGAAIDTLASSTVGRSIALRIDGAHPHRVDPGADAEDLDWKQYDVATGGTPGRTNVQTTFGSWQEEHFTPAEISDPTISGESADPDRDGVVNLLEYAFNDDPRDALEAHRPAAGPMQRRYRSSIKRQWGRRT